MDMECPTTVIVMFLIPANSKINQLLFITTCRKQFENSNQVLFWGVDGQEIKIMTDKLEWQFYLVVDFRMVFNFNLLLL